MQNSNWYKNHWSLKKHLNAAWTKNTEHQVTVLENMLQLKPNANILDLACGFGRHSLEFSRRGYRVTGVDLCREFVDFASQQAKQERLEASFIRSDVRNFNSNEKFDIVLSLFDGAIGYLESQFEDQKIFNTVKRNLKQDGVHLAHILNQKFYSKKCPFHEEVSVCGSTTYNFYLWDEVNNTLIHSGYTEKKKLNSQVDPSLQGEASHYRLYSVNEISKMLDVAGLELTKVKPAFCKNSVHALQSPELIILSKVK